MNQIRLLSRLLRYTFAICTILYPAFILYIMWLTEKASNPVNGVLGYSSQFSYRLSGDALNWLQTAPLHHKVLHYLANGFGEFIIITILLHLMYLFKLFEHGEIFTRNTVRMIKRISFLVLGSVVYSPISEAISTLALTLHKPEGERLISISANHIDLMMVLSAGVAFVIAWIMDEGRKLQDDVKLTV